MSFTLNMKSRAYHRIVELSLEYFFKDNDNDNLKFHFSNQEPAYDDRDDFQDHYQEEDDYEEDQGNSGNAPKHEGAERAMFVKALGVDSKQGKGTSMGSSGVPKLVKRDNSLRIKVQIKGANSVESGVPKPIYTEGGLRPAEPDGSKTLKIKLDGKTNPVSKINPCSGQERATVAVGDSVDTSTLVETVVGKKPSLDFERKVGKITG